MKHKNLLEIIKSGSFSIPLYLYKMKDEFKIDADTFLFLMYLVSIDEKFIFDSLKLKEKLNLSVATIMEFISKLSDAKLLSVDVIKNDKGIMEEYINLGLFYDKVNNILVDEVNKEKDEDVFGIIQKEFGRLLSPIEVEIVNAWIDSKISEELIIEAVKEAILNGVTNLRYIDKILYEWGKKGIKTRDDVVRNKEKYRKDNEVKKPVKKEVFDYNWLEDDSD